MSEWFLITVIDLKAFSQNISKLTIIFSTRFNIIVWAYMSVNSIDLISRNLDYICLYEDQDSTEYFENHEFAWVWTLVKKLPIYL